VKNGETRLIPFHPLGRFLLWNFPRYNYFLQWRKLHRLGNDIGKRGDPAYKSILSDAFFMYTSETATGVGKRENCTGSIKNKFTCVVEGWGRNVDVFASVFLSRDAIFALRIYVGLGRAHKPHKENEVEFQMCTVCLSSFLKRKTEKLHARRI
jgi:hypothetical protein